MIRVLVQGGTLPESEQHHLRVRRAEDGELAEVRDGRGLVGQARLVREGKTWSVDILTTGTVAPPPELVLAVGAGDRDRFGWLVEKAAELGVTRIVPLETARTAAVASKIRAAHLDRLRQRALEAIKQSGAAWAPVVEPVTSLDGFVRAAVASQGWRWLADAGGEPMPAELEGGEVTVAIGPEGGFESEERALLVANGFEPVTLGPHVLRFETAAVAAAASVTAARQRSAQRARL